MPYSNYRRDQMILRDYLARDRTVLANERTLLAYIRTSIALLAAGGTLCMVFPANLWMQILGLLLMVFGVVVVFLGGWRFKIVAGHMRGVGAASETLPPESSDQSQRPAERSGESM